MSVTSPLFVFAFLSGATALVCGVFISGRWHKPGSGWYVVSIVGAVCWTFGYAVGLLVFDPDVRWILEIPIWIGHGLTPVAFFLFVLQYTGRLEWVSPSRHALVWTIPVVTVLVVLTNDTHHLMWSSYEVVPTADAATVRYDKGPWLYAHKVYTYTILAAAAVVLVQMAAARDSLYTAQAGALVAVMSPLPVASVAWLFELGPYPQISPTPYLFGLLYAVATFVLFRSALFDSAPAARRIGKRRVIDDFEDGVLLVNDTDRIVDANGAAQKTLETDRSELIGAPVMEVLPELDRDGEDDELSPGRYAIQLETATGYRNYEVIVSTVSGVRGDPLGYSLVFHDVTDETRRRQRLTVLNRVLRHNLRNDLNVIQTYARELQANVDDSAAEFASVIVDQSNELAALGEKARRIERTLDVPDGTPTQVSLETAVESIVDHYDDDASFSVDVDDLEISTYPTLLETVLEDAIENAVVHGGDYPSVHIDATTRERGSIVELTITDDGPGIPENELGPIEAGTETALEHGSGLGLWLIAWGTAQLGGSVSFSRLEGSDSEREGDGERGSDDERGGAHEHGRDSVRGTEVRIRLPRTIESERSDSSR